MRNRLWTVGVVAPLLMLASVPAGAGAHTGAEPIVVPVVKESEFPNTGQPEGPFKDDGPPKDRTE